jgi:hypothetical protein
MVLYFVPNRGYVSDQDEDIPFYGSFTLPDQSLIEWGDKGVREVPTYSNPWQFPGEDRGRSTFQWEPGMAMPDMPLTPPGYIQQLLQWADQAEAGQLKDYERDQWEQMRQQAMAVPTRDLARLTSAARGGFWGGVPEEADAAWYLTQGSPDLGAIMLGLRDKINAGSATDAERSLFEDVRKADAYQNWVASTPQPSDAFNPLGDQFMMALNALTMAVGGAGSFGAFGAAGAGAAGAGAGSSVLGIPTSTLAQAGMLGGYGAQGAGMLGTALQQPWLTRLAGALGAASGLAGGVAGLGNLAASGVQNVSDVGRLLQSTGRVTGALGAVPGADPLRQAGRYLGLAGQVGQAGGGAADLFQTAQGVQAGATGGGRMGEWDWLNLDLSYPAAGSGEGYGVLDPWSAGGGGAGINWNDPTQWPTETPENWYRDVGQYIGGSDPNAEGTDGGWLSSVLGTLGQVGGFLGKNASWLGPAVSGLTSLGAGAMGAGAAGDAAAAQAGALQRGLDLQAAQWLQTQANQAPWLEAGRQALPQLQQLAGQGAPSLQQLAPLRGQDYAMPGVMPGWNPEVFQGPAPVAAADYRYTPGQVPGAAQYRYTPGALPTLSGQELLAQDPGVQFRLDRAQRALEASQAARGGALSGSALRALQEQGQDLASQEYGAAWQRAAQRAQMREGWAQTASQLGFGQAMDETRLREQLAQLASAQNWQQALQGQQTAYGQQLQGRQQTVGEFRDWFDTWYNRGLQQNQLQYARDWQEREAQNQRLLEAYNAQRLGDTTAWNRWSSLAGLGQTSVGQLATSGQNIANQQATLLGQLGSAQAMGQLGPAYNWNQALAGGASAIGNLLKGLNA